MTRSKSAAEQRAHNRKALARKAAAKKTIITKESATRSTAAEKRSTATSSTSDTSASSASSAAPSALPFASATATKTSNGSSRTAGSGSRSGRSSGSSSTARSDSTGNRSGSKSGAKSRSKADAKSGTKSRAKRGTTARRESEVEIAARPAAAQTTSTRSGRPSRAERREEKGTSADRRRRQVVIDLDPDTEVVVEPANPARGPFSRFRTRLRAPDRFGGVAPFVPPRSRPGRSLARRRWARRGFVPLSPGRPKLIRRILPRTVIGISFMLLAFAVGAAFSGAAFYAYYDDRLAENEETVARFVEGFDRQFTDAAGAIDDLRVGAIDDIRGELLPLDDYVNDANGVINLPVTAGPSVWLLETKDDSGRIIGGASFAVAAHGDGTAFITSYSLVATSTTSPSPAIELSKDGRRLPAQLWAWDREHDLALVVVADQVPPLELATERQQVESVGSRVFALGGIGGQGATAAPGVLLDQSQRGLQHTTPIGTLFEGGPLLTGNGAVVGVATLNYRPYGFDPGDVAQAPDIAGICARILACADRGDDLDVSVAADLAEAPPASGETLRQAADTGTEADAETDAADANDEAETDDGE